MQFKNLFAIIAKLSQATSKDGQKIISLTDQEHSLLLAYLQSLKLEGKVAYIRNLLANKDISYKFTIVDLGPLDRQANLGGLQLSIVLKTPELGAREWCTTEGDSAARFNTICNSIISYAGEVRRRRNAV